MVTDIFICSTTSFVLGCYLRYVNRNSLDVHEDCIGLYATDKMEADTVTKLILDSLTWLIFL